MNGNLYAAFEARFPADRGRAFIEFADGVLHRTYADLDSATARLANLLQNLGVRPGDRVVAQTEKSPEALMLYLACLRAGAVYVPLNTAYRPAEVDYFLSDSEPRVAVCDPGAHAALLPLAAKAGVAQLLTLGADGRGTLTERAERLEISFATISRASDDLAAILYTSGTTGRSKGAMLTHGNLASNAQTLHRIWGFAPGDILLHALPIYHTHGLFVACNCVLLNGSTMIFLPKFDGAEVARLLGRATVFMGVPTYYTRLLSLPGFGRDACRTMRLFISGSAPLLEDTFREFQARTGHTILERYGMTEAGMITSNPLIGARIAGSVGPPLPGVEARIADDAGRVLGAGEVGVLEIKGPNVFKGYWRNAEKTREEFRADGYFITGDIARIDANGHVSIVGRAKDLIISGGLNVYPKEIELALDALDGVAESAVIGLPHADFGEAVAGVIAVKPGATPTSGAMIDVLKESIAAFKVPKVLFFVDDLPRNAMGKVQKNVLRERYKATFSR
ncbi:MAG: malonate--CoA ligase [Alphaproteobacteria bacterium]